MALFSWSKAMLGGWRLACFNLTVHRFHQGNYFAFHSHIIVANSSRLLSDPIVLVRCTKLKHLFIS
jgi:hypothetical protein